MNDLIERVRAYAASGKSGELICVAPPIEVHVYFQDGRIAWATDSQHPFAFGAHLQETVAIDIDTFRQVVEECRRNRLSLGETLVGWGLASWDAVRASLQHQIRLALGVLEVANRGGAQVLFLERGYRRYDAQLTFEVDSVLGAPPPAPPSAVSLAPLSASKATQPELAARIRAAIDGLTWVEILEAGQHVESDPPATTPRVPSALVEISLLDGADFVAVRAARSALVGISVGQSRSAWSRISAEATYGVAVASLTSMLADRAREGTHRRAPAGRTSAWKLDGSDPLAQLAIGDFFERAAEVLGVVVLGGDAERSVGAAIGSEAIEQEKCVALARRRHRCFTSGQSAGGEGKALASMGFYLRTLVTGEPDVWCFGAELDADTGATAWIFLDRQSSQGLGWACLSALARTLTGNREVAIAS